MHQIQLGHLCFDKFVTKRFKFSLAKIKTFSHWIRFLNDKFFNLVAVIICIVIIAILALSTTFSHNLSLVLFNINSNVISFLEIPNNIYLKLKNGWQSYYQYELTELRNKNKLLQKNIDDLTIENLEIKNLKQLLNFSLPQRYNFVTTRLLRSSINILSQEFIIPLGSNDGVDETSFVVNNIGLVGKVSEVGRNTSKVKLITNINSKTPVIFTESRQKAILHGSSTYTNTLNIDYCSDYNGLKDNEMAVTSGDGQIYPPDIIVGQLVKTGDKYQIQTVFSIDQLEYVKVYNLIK